MCTLHPCLTPTVTPIINHTKHQVLQEAHPQRAGGDRDQPSQVHAGLSREQGGDDLPPERAVQVYVEYILCIVSE